MRPPDAAAAAWVLAFDRLADDDPPALALLTLVAWLGPEPVPADLLTGHADHLPAPLATSDPAQLIATLGRRGLARVDGESLQLHQVPAAPPRPAHVRGAPGRRGLGDLGDAAPARLPSPRPRTTPRAGPRGDG